MSSHDIAIIKNRVYSAVIKFERLEGLTGLVRIYRELMCRFSDTRVSERAQEWQPTERAGPGTSPPLLALRHR